MQWTIDFDIAAFFICLILFIVFLSYKNFPTIESRIYRLFLGFALGSTITDMLAAYAGSYWGDRYLLANYIVHIIHMIVQNAVPALYCLFAFSMVYEEKTLHRKQLMVIFLPYLVCVAAILTTPVTRLMFYFTDGAYHRGIGQSILYVSAVYYIVLSCSLVIAHMKELTVMQRMSVLFYTFANLITVGLQLFFPHYLLQEFGIAFAAFFIYLTMQNPLEFKDMYTETYNRNSFIKVVTALIAEHKPFSVLCVQIDGFQYINEKFGITNGNRLLRQLAEYLTNIDKRNLVFHMTGTQFVIIIYDVEKCRAYTDNIINRMNRPFFLNNVEVTIWSYLCCVNYPDNVRNLDDVMNTIDYTIHLAKSNQRNCVLFGTTDIIAQKKRESDIEHAIAYAVLHKTFEVYYQPIYCVHSKRYTSAEALIRLKDKDLGFIPPDEFIPMAEKSGEILTIGEIVLEKVCAFISTHHPEDAGIQLIHVNLSVVQCMQENIAQRLLAIIDRYSIPHTMINFEITETSAANSGERLSSMMEFLESKNIRFALDDFGTGYSNTVNIMKHNYSIVKLDKSIVWAAQESTRASISLKHTIAMVKDLNMSVLAEGTERDGQVQSLVDFGCEYFQGYFFSRPLTEDTFMDVVRENKIAGDQA